MKTKSSLVFLVFVLSFALNAMPSSPSTSCTPAPSGLVSWWPGEGNAHDIIGTNNGTLAGGASYAAGEVGQAFLFDGTSGYVSIPDSPLMDSFTNRMTVELWMKVNQVTVNSGWQGIVTKGNSSWRLQGTSGANTLTFSANGVSPNSNLSGNRNVNDGQWHHVAAVYNGTNLFLYVDGTLDATQPATGLIAQDSYPLCLGANAQGPGGLPTLFFNGLVDEVSLYSRALTASEIQAIYAAGSGGKCPPFPTAPSITTQPANLTVFVGGSATFSVTAGGTTPLSYQWNFNGTNIVGATNTMLTLTNMQLNQAGNYAVLVTNNYGSILSSNAVLMVNPPGPGVCDEADLQAAVASGGIFTFGCDGVITLTTTLVVTKPTTIDGTGHAVTLSGNGAVRVFQVNSGVSLTLCNLTIANGWTNQGAGLYSAGGIVTISNCMFRSNVAQGVNGTNAPPDMSGPGGSGTPALGGAVYTEGVLTIMNSSFISNSAVGGSGGSGSYFASAGNGAVGLGGSIYAATCLTITNCLFTYNSARGGIGGSQPAGNSNYGFPGDGAVGAGGAIYTTYGLTISSCVFATNSAVGGDGGENGPGFGGGAGGNASGGAVVCSNASIGVGCIFSGNRVVSGVTGIPRGEWFRGSAGGGAIAAASLNLAGSILSGNSIAGSPASGGAIFCSSDLELSNTMFIGNSASADTGSPYYIGSGSAGSGGGIYSGSNAVIIDCTIATNSASGGRSAGLGGAGGLSSGGGLYSLGSLNLSRCTVVGNSIIGGSAQAIPSYGYPGGDAYGAGIFCQSSHSSLVNCTIVANKAQGGLGIFAQGGNAYGGGLYANAMVSLTNCTFATNQAIGNTGGNYSGPPSDGFGGNVEVQTGMVQIANTILTGGVSNNAYGSLIDLGYNLSSDASCAFTNIGSLNNTDPQLGPLGNYGGPTPTMALLPGSPAIDAIPAALAPSTDQRGYPRPYGTASDIGAFEWFPLYTVAGKVWGVKSANGVIVTAGSASTTAANSGIYLLNNLVPGSYTVTPSNASYVFVPNSRSVTVGPDQTNVDFKAYGWNAFGLEGISNGTVQLRYAGTNGQTYRVLTATNLTGQWLPVATNALSASNYFDLFLPMTGEPLRLYRVVNP